MCEYMCKVCKTWMQDEECDCELIFKDELCWKCNIIRIHEDMEKYK